MATPFSDAALDAYGRFAGDPNTEQLRRYFQLDDSDRQRITAKKGAHNRLGYAIQLTTLRYLGTFLTDPLDVPEVVVQYVARQLEIQPGRAKLGTYRRGETKWDHRHDIQTEYGYTDFSEPRAWIGYLRFLLARTHLRSESPSVLLDLSTARLVERKIILPGITLTRLIARVQERADEQLWANLANRLSPTQRVALASLLVRPKRSKTSRFEALRQAPISISAQGLLGALERVERIRNVGVREVDLSGFPEQRLERLTRIGMNAKAQALDRMNPNRQLAVLLVTVSRLEASALDDALTILDSLFTDVFNRAERQDLAQRVEALPTLEAAARTQNGLALAFLEHLGAEHQDFQEFARLVLEITPKTDLEQAVQTVQRLTKSPADTRLEQLLTRFSYVQQFLPRLLETVAFAASRSGKPLLAALEALRGAARDSAVRGLPVDWARGPWKRQLRSSDETVRRGVYTLGVVEQLHHALKRRDLYVPDSRKWGDPRSSLLSGNAWTDLKPEVCRSLDLDPNPYTVLSRLQAQLDETYWVLAERLPQHSSASIETVEGKSRLILQLDEAQESSPSLLELQDEVAARMPRIDLPDLLLDVQRWTGFADAFVHLSEGRARVNDLATSVCAVLLSEACNVGLESVVQPDREALRSGRLSWVNQHYVRAETIAAANARLVEFQAGIPGLPDWGEGQVAAVDGLRFRVPVKSIHAGHNPKYFGVGSGVTYLNFVSDQFTSFHGIVVPGTLRDSMYALDGLIEQNTVLQPKQLVSDTGASSYMIFGLFALLGFQFSPELADLPERRYWRMDLDADYGPLNAIARNRIDSRLIAAHWDDLLRIAGSLLTRTVRASNLIRVIGVKPKGTMVRALEQFGRISYTQHLLTYHDDPMYRRVIGTQRNHQEARHRLARAVFQGERGELRQHYIEGMEDQLGALGLLMNAIVVWNSRYIALILAQLRAEGKPVRAEDARRLSPLKFGHIHLKGRYRFAVDDSSLSDGVRKLRDPDELEE
jgi:TnpA family transposase